MPLKNKKFFIDTRTYSMIGLDVPDKKSYSIEYEVTMRDCNRQIHWMFSKDKKGLTKAKKVAEFFNALHEELKENVK
jgi:hypothetical protein